MALATGTIVVACPGPGLGGGPLKGLFAVDPTSGQQRTLAQGDMLAEPWNVVFLADGRLLVADASAFGTGGLIAVDPANGQQTKVASSSQFRSPFGLALAPDGHVAVVYTLHQLPAGSSRVALVDPATGQDSEVFHGFPFVQPFAVAVDAAGNLIVTDPGDFTGFSRLIRSDIGVGVSIRHEGEGAFSGIAVEPTGKLVVTSDLTTRQQLLRFDPTTGPPTVVSRVPTGLTGGIAVEASGAILVTDVNGVLRVDPVTGAQTAVASMRGAAGLAVRR
jgi:outer membrane protein assembly factor BamB